MTKKHDLDFKSILVFAPAFLVMGFVFDTMNFIKNDPSTFSFEWTVFTSMFSVVVLIIVGAMYTFTRVSSDETK